MAGPCGLALSSWACFSRRDRPCRMSRDAAPNSPSKTNTARLSSKEETRHQTVADLPVLAGPIVNRAEIVDQMRQNTSSGNG